MGDVRQPAGGEERGGERPVWSPGEFYASDLASTRREADRYYARAMQLTDALARIEYWLTSTDDHLPEARRLAGARRVLAVHKATPEATHWRETEECHQIGEQAVAAVEQREGKAWWQR
jgi:hypothetical protein